MTTNAAAIPLSLSYHTVPELTPPETVSVAAAAGCRFVGVRLLHGQPGHDLAPLMQDAALRRETLARLAGTGLGVLDASGARLTPTTDMVAFEPFLDTAAEMGTRHVLATGDDPDEPRLVARIAELCSRAARRGLTVDLEFVPWMTVRDAATAARVGHAVAHAAFGVAVDALHFSRSRSTTSDLAAMPRAWFRYVQLCDAPGNWSNDRNALLHEAVKERLFPGDGAIDLPGLLRALPRGIPVALEIPTATLARSVPALDRVRRAVAATRAVLAAAYAG